MTTFFQVVIPRSLDVPLSVFTILGTAEVTSLALVVTVYLLWRQGKFAWSFLVSFFLLHVVELLGKFFIPHSPPPPALLRYQFPINIPMITVETNYSFPSGHVSRTMFLAVIFLFFFRKKWWAIPIAGVLVFLMVVSRVYLGEHWGSDVLGGLFLGAASGFLALVYY